MRSATALVLLAGLAVFAAPASAKCVPRGAKVVLRGSKIVVYRPHRHANLTACYRPTQRRERLEHRARRFRTQGRRALAVAGDHLVYASNDERHPATRPVFQFVTRMNMRTRRSRVEAPNDCCTVEVGDMVASARGSSAWIACIVDGDDHGCTPTGGDYRVWIWRAHRANPVLAATGRHIRPHSLRLRRHTLSWVQGGKRRSRVLR